MVNEDTPLVPSHAHPVRDNGSIKSMKKHKSRAELSPSAARARKKLQLACVFSILFMLAEIIGGFLAGSLAIMTDAAHLLSDVGGFCISLFALWVGSLPASSTHSFGFQRAEVLGAVISVLVIWVLTGCLVYAAVERFMEDLSGNRKEQVDGKLMFIVACIGLVVNIVLMKILSHGHGHSHGGGHGHSHGPSIADLRGEEQHGHSHDHGHGHSHGSHDLEEGSPQKKKLQEAENINIQAAYIHALGDFFQSIGVCVAGGLIWYKPEWQIADPIATFLFSIIVLGTTIGVIRDSVHVLMEGTPEGIDLDEIETGLRALPSVKTIHDLHIWSLSLGVPSLSTHVVSEDADVALHEAQEFLMSHGINHTTIQVEKSTYVYPSDCGDLLCGQSSPSESPHGV